jgi:hypothetical protein
VNTANLQLEGLYLALASVLSLLREKNLVSEQEIDSALASAEVKASFDPDRPQELSAAHVDAICFPLRLLRPRQQRTRRRQAAVLHGARGESWRD